MIKYSEIKEEISLFKHGFYKPNNIENFDFSSLLENAKKIEVNSDDQKSGYSTDIYEYLDEESKTKLITLSNDSNRARTVFTRAIFKSSSVIHFFVV